MIGQSTKNFSTSSTNNFGLVAIARCPAPFITTIARTHRLAGALDVSSPVRRLQASRRCATSGRLAR
jgi:hypothetical protein